MRIFSPRLSWVSRLPRRILAFHFADRAIQHLGVELEADGLDVAALLAAQQVAGSAQFQIESGNFEAGAQIGKFFQGRQTATCNGRQLVSGGTSR